MKFKNTISVERLSNKESLKFLTNLSDLLDFSGQSWANKSIQELVAKESKNKLNTSITFDKEPCTNGIGNNQVRRIIYKTENREITLGYLHMTHNMYGTYYIFFSTSEKGRVEGSHKARAR